MSNKRVISIDCDIPDVNQEQGQNNSGDGSDAQKSDIDLNTLIYYPVLRRGEKTAVIAPQKFKFETESFISEPSEESKIPTSHSEAVNGLDAELWKDAIDSKMEALNTLAIWVLTVLTHGLKVIETKWVYNLKQNDETRRCGQNPNSLQEVSRKSKTMTSLTFSRPSQTIQLYVFYLQYRCKTNGSTNSWTLRTRFPVQF